MTTAGSLALEGSIAARDAFVAARLREAGAVILGKTNLSEWANFRSSKSTSGWSGRGGQVRNPYALDRNPCGSSSGTGAAIAANLAAIGVGTETDGSIVCPSGATGLVGIKPTVGLVSRSGIIPISHTQDTAGPMARTVADAAVLLAAMTGVDPRDRATAASSGQRRGLHGVPQSGRPDGGADRRCAQEVLRLQPGHRSADRAGDRRHEGTGGGDRRSGRHSVSRHARRLRVRDPALRVQGGPEHVPRRPRPCRQGAFACRCHRVQLERMPIARCRSSVRRPCCRRRRRDR